MEKNTTPNRRSINYGIFSTASPRKYEVKPAYELIADRSKSFSLNNKGDELTTGEYISYIALLEEYPQLKEKGIFPRNNPTRDQFSALQGMAEEKEFDLASNLEDDDTELDA
jgi:hypothetical protein